MHITRTAVHVYPSGEEEKTINNTFYSVLAVPGVPVHALQQTVGLDEG